MHVLLFGVVLLVLSILLTTVFAGPRVRPSRGVLVAAYQVALVRTVLGVYHQRGTELVHHRPRSVLQYQWWFFCTRYQVCRTG